MTERAPTPAWGTVVRDELQPLWQRHVLWLTVALLLGIAWADAVAPPCLPVALLGALAVLVTALALRRFPGAAARLLLLCCFLLGAALHAWRLAPGVAAQLPPTGVSLARLEGLVVATEGHFGDVQRLHLSWRDPRGHAFGRVVCQVPAGPPLHVGDSVALLTVHLRPIPPTRTPGERDEARAYARRGLHLQATAQHCVRVRPAPPWRGRLEGVLARVRGHCLALLVAAMPGAMPETYASLLASMVYGMTAAPVPPEIVDLFRRSGTIHLLVASGAQVTIIALSLVFLVRGTRRVLPLWGFLVVTAGLVAFALLAGMDISIRRALGMSVILLGTYAWGRRYDLPSALALTALVLCLCDTALVFDAGAQLTYACAAGVYLAWPPARLGQPLLLRVLVAAGWSSLGAWLLATPILVAHFHNMVLLGTLANLIAVPLAAVLLYLGLVAILAGLIWPPLALPPCALARVLLDVMLASNTFFATLPLATLDRLYWPWPWLLLWYVLAGAALALLRSRRLRDRLRASDLRWTAAAGVCVLGGVLLGVALSQPSASRLRVRVLDVGAGQCVLVQAPAATILVDAGADAASGHAESILTRRVLPYLALRRVGVLDAIVISHAHEDHCNLAAPLLGAIPTRRLLLGPATGAEASWLRMLRTAEAQGLDVAPFTPGTRLCLGPHTWLEALGSPRPEPFTTDPVNNGSLVLRLVHGQTTVLLPADLGAEGEQRLLAQYPQPGQLRADVLLAPHHGSGGSCTRPFLQAVAARDIIISCGTGKRGPPPRTLRTLAQCGLHVWRTDVDGVVTLTSDGRTVTVQGSARARR